LLTPEKPLRYYVELMKEALRQRARELGFDDCRFTTASPPESAPHLQRWLAERKHGEMAYLERNAQKRVEPQQVLPGARSILSLSVSYAQPGSRPSLDGSRVTVSPVERQ
jgi:epoxyqueuosine reductase